jgi:hypothetical protein
MAKVSVLAAQVAGTVADQTAVAYTAQATPFIPGRVVVGVIDSGSAAGTAPAYHIQGSNTSASTGFTNLLSSAALGRKVGNITLHKWMRFSIETAAGTAGVGVSAELWADS